MKLSGIVPDCEHSLRLACLFYPMIILSPCVLVPLAESESLFSHTYLLVPSAEISYHSYPNVLILLLSIDILSTVNSAVVPCLFSLTVHSLASLCPHQFYLSTCCIYGSPGRHSCSFLPSVSLDLFRYRVVRFCLAADVCRGGLW